MTTKTKNKSEAETAKSAATETSSSPPRPNSKIGKVVALLQRKEGATLGEMTKATGWQPHSACAALTGLKKKGHVIAKSKRDDVTCYSIEAAL